MLQTMRTLLYVPGNKENMIQKAAGCDADVIVMDLEDAVPPAEKAAARDVVARAIATGVLGSKRAMVRINGTGSPECPLDVEAAVARGVMALRIPKVESASEIRDLEAMVSKQEKKAGLEAGSIRFAPILESPLGVVKAFEIATASKRVMALTIGAEDLTVGLGTQRSREGLELQWARGQVVMCAAAANVAAFDTVFSDVKDEEGLIAETRLIKQMGFAGKSVIHPKQVAPIHAIFTPTDEEVQKARRIVEAFLAAKATGSGTISVDGRMVDLPVVIRAKRTLALAGVRVQGADDE